MKCPPYLKKDCPEECAKYESSTEAVESVVAKEVKSIPRLCEQALKRRERCPGFVLAKCEEQCRQFEPVDDAPKKNRRGRRPAKPPLCKKITSRCAVFMVRMCPEECTEIVRKAAQERWSMALSGIKRDKKPARTVAEYCLFHPFAKFVRTDKENFGMTITCTGDIGSGLEVCFFNDNSPGEVCRNTYQQLDACELDSQNGFAIELVFPRDVQRLASGFAEDVKVSLLRGVLTEQSLMDDKLTFHLDKSDPGQEQTFRLADKSNIPIDKHAICKRISSKCSRFLVQHCPDECALHEEDERIGEVERSLTSSSNGIVERDGLQDSGDTTPRKGTAVDLCQLPQYTDLHRVENNTSQDADNKFLLYFACDDEQGSGFKVCIFRSNAPALQSCRRSFQHLANYPLTHKGEVWEFEIALESTVQVREETVLRGHIAKTAEGSEIIFESKGVNHVYRY